ncbi:MAG: glutamine amidotransferase [Clostridiales bacterium]|jgi:CobQ-like glutamine amidotransferase family enzyme|nr:glutamine amidotransferase [Clostridiales bacterium]
MVVVVNILHMYPDLLNLYSDRGNIECMKRRLLWRNIDANVIELTTESENIDLNYVDIIFIGGGSDREQKIVCEKLLCIKNKIRKYVEDQKVLLAVCGGYQLLGKYYKIKDEMLEGLGILDIYTESSDKRIIGNIILENELFDNKIVGFENHAGRTFNNCYKPFGKILIGGCYNNFEFEGVMHENIIGTYLHGPLLPKNPLVCDHLLNKALKQKYEEFLSLSKLNDDLEISANSLFCKKFLGKRKF